MIIYIGGSITSKSYNEAVDYFNCYSMILSEYGYRVFHPMVGKAYLKNEKKLKPEGYKFPVSTNHAIVERDYWMVSQADVIFFDFTSATSVSIGSMFELAWAQQLRKHTIVVMKEGNPHWHSFVLEAADIVFPNRNAALSYLRKLISMGL